jgi:hypothetical protein
LSKNAFSIGAIGVVSMGPVNFNAQIEQNNEKGSRLIQHAFFDIGPGNYGVRLGRVQHLLGFYNQTRSIPCCSDFINLPPAIYREQFKQLATSGDGVQGYYIADIDSWEVGINVTLAKPILSPMENIIAGHFNTVFPGEFTNKSLVKGLNITILSPDRTTQLRYDHIHLDFVFDSEFPPIASGKMNTIVHTAGVRHFYTHSDVTLEGILVQQNSNVWDSFFALTGGRLGNPVGAMLSYRYRPTDNNQIATYADLWCSGAEDCSGEKRSQLTGMPAHNFYVRSVGVAWRHKYPDKWYSNLQYTRGQGSNAHYYDQPHEKDWQILQLRISKAF